MNEIDPEFLWFFSNKYTFAGGVCVPNLKEFFNLISQFSNIIGHIYNDSDFIVAKRTKLVPRKKNVVDVKVNKNLWI